MTIRCTPAGAHARAVIYSLVQTAKADGLAPYTWLRRGLRNLPAAKTVEDVEAVEAVDAVEALLPWNLRVTDLLDKNDHGLASSPGLVQRLR